MATATQTSRPSESQWDQWETHQCRLGTDRIARAIAPRIDGRDVDALELLDDAFGELSFAEAQNVLGYLAGLR